MRGGKTIDDFFDRLGKDPRLNLACGVALILVAVGALCFGVTQISKYHTIKSNFTRAEATIIDCDPDADTEDMIDYYTVVLEYSVDGKMHKYTYRNKIERTIGVKDVLYYDPENPEKVYLENDLGGISFWSFIIAGVAGVVGGGFVYTSFWIKAKQQKAS